jgi:hypothetical protein
MGLFFKLKFGIHTVLLLNISILIFMSGCRHSDEETQDIEKWTSTDPLAVNYRARHNKYIAGNLLTNPSFEQGRIKRNLSEAKQIKIEGWEIIGKDVKWINLSDSAENDNNSLTHSGQRSICIQRTQADETESIGQGVLSDYIKVIPGNYRLTLYLNLKNIKNPKSRLGTKIYDAVDIRVLFYDRNKLQIDGEQYSAYYNQRINCSFKGVSFSNFDQIDSTGWLHINGYSHVFPFADGDVPDETKFVKIFIGLKGTGILWADDINFSYTNQNLTTFERLSKFFDSTYAKAKLIIPHPKKVQILESKIYYRKNQPQKLPYILLQPAANQKSFYLAKSLENKIIEVLVTVGGLNKKDIPALIKISENEIPADHSIIFSIGETDLFKKYDNNIPLWKIEGREQGYLIYSVHTLSDVIFIYGNSDEADYYAIQSVLQLFDNKRLLFHNANIIDYPDETTRSFLLAGKEKSQFDYRIDDNFRFNRFYLPSSFDWGCSFDSMQQPVQRFLYFNIDRNINSSDLNLIHAGIKENSKCFDGFAFLFSNLLSNEIDIDQSIKNYYYSNNNSLENIEMFLKSINALIINGLKIEVLTPENIYFNQLPHIEGIKHLWSGKGLQSWQIDESEIYRLNHFCNVQPGLIDFSLYPHSKAMEYFGNDTLSPYKNLTSCLFEPYENEIVEEVYEKTDAVIAVYSYSNILDRIRLRTTSDFYWNRDNYNPDFELFKVLISEFGFDASYDILRFNDLYFKARSELVLAGNKKNFHKNARKAYQTINDLKKVENKLKTKYTISSLKELNSIFAILISDLEQMKNDLGYTPIIQ